MAGAQPQVPCTTAWEVRHGRTRRMDIPAGGLPLTSGGDYPLPIAMQGKADALFEPWALGQAAAMVRRVTPWVRAVFAPDFREDCGFDGPAERIWNGVCWRRRGVILVVVDRGVPGVLSTVAHECWHALEDVLSPEELAVVDADTAGGLDFAGDDYYASSVERRARAFQWYAMSAVESGRLSAGTACDRLFRAAYQGRIGLRGRRWLAESQYPEETRALLGNRAGRWTAAVEDAFANGASVVARLPGRVLRHLAWGFGVA